ncbi:hypothetical protein ANN_15332 [Periplaneta americana]|uniref:Reverse transcriptase domain-containing protein n=1 Tax=Periplaneta americana TaxID=6978 RepID=A0ABQ8SG38_PERAM|nr:hypothetical protein ANN_15332 [Periplaneta americana]
MAPRERVESALGAQPCSSGCLFIIYLDDLVKNCFQNMRGVKVGGKIIKCIRFADDMTFLAEEEMILRDMLLELNDSSGQYGMKINANQEKDHGFRKKNKEGKLANLNGAIESKSYLALNYEYTSFDNDLSIMSVLRVLRLEHRNPVANTSYNGWGDHRANHTIPPFWLDDRPPLLRHVGVRPAAGWSVQALDGLEIRLRIPAITAGDHRANHTIPPFWLDDRPPLLRHVGVRPAAGWSVQALDGLSRGEIGYEWKWNVQEAFMGGQQFAAGRAVKFQRMERKILQLSLRNEVRNEELCNRTAESLKWKWGGHVVRMDQRRWTHRLTLWDPRIGRRRVGRQTTRWADFFKNKAGAHWTSSTRDRQLWRDLEATVLSV